MLEAKLAFFNICQYILAQKNKHFVFINVPLSKLKLLANTIDKRCFKKVFIGYLCK